MMTTRLSNRHLFSVLCTLALTGLTWAGCSDDSSSGATCGDGTELVGGQCIPVSTGGGTGDMLTCGAGTVNQGGMCVPDGGTSNATVCGQGTTEINGECVPDGVVVCGPGTTEVGGECVPDDVVVCGPGTTEMNGECVPDDVVVCGPGTTEDENGECVPNFPEIACGDGTVEVEGECVPVDPFMDVDVMEGTEPNDDVIAERMGTVTDVMLGGVGDTTMIQGMVGEPDVIDFGFGEQLVPDLDTYAVSLNKGSRLRIEATAVGVPQVAAIVEYETPAESDEEPVLLQRLLISFDDRNASREIIAPFSGVYRITVGFQTDLLDIYGLTNPLFGPFGDAQGGENFTYIMALTPLDNPAPDMQSGAFTWNADLEAIPQTLLNLPATSLIDVEMEVNGAPGANGLYWISTSDYNDYDGSFIGGRHPVPEGGLLITADHFWLASEDSTFSMTVELVDSEDQGDFAAGDMVAAEDLELGVGGEYHYTFNVTEPTVVRVTTVPTDDSFALPIVVVRDAGYGVLGAAVAGEDEAGTRSVTVALTEPGIHYVQLIEDSQLVGMDVPYEVDVMVEGIAPIVPLSDSPLDAVNTTGTATTAGELLPAGSAAYFFYEAADLGSLTHTAAPMPNLDVTMELYSDPQLATGDVFAPDQTVNDVEAGTDEVFTAVNQGVFVVRLINNGEENADMGEATLTVAGDFGAILREEEPNQNEDEAGDLGTLGLDPVLAVGGLDLGEQDAVIDYWSFTLEFPAIVTITTDAAGPEGPDTTLTLFDDMGQELAFNDDDGDLTSAIVQILSPGTYFVAVDGFLGGEEPPYALGVSIEPIEGDDDFGLGETATFEGVELGVDADGFLGFALYAFEVTEPMVLTATAVPQEDSISEPVMVIGNSDQIIIAQDVAFDEEYAVTVAIHEPGTYYVQALEDSFDVFDVELVDITVESVAPLAQLGDTLNADNLTATAVDSELFDAGNESYYWVDVEGLGDLTLTATPLMNLNVAMELYFGQELADSSGFNPDLAADLGAAGEAEILESVAGGVYYIRLINTGDSALDMIDLTLDAALVIPDGVVDEVEPNEDISIATPLGTLDPDATAFGRGVIEPGPLDEFGFPGPSVDTFSFTLDALSEVTVTASGIGNATTFDLEILTRLQESVAADEDSVTVALRPGTYFVTVDADAESAEYRLEVDIRALVCFPGEAVCNGNTASICNEDGTDLVEFGCAGACIEDETGAACEAFEDIEPNSDAASAQDLGSYPVGTLIPVEGEIDSSAARDGDWFSFTLETTSIVTLETLRSQNSPDDFDTEMWLYDADENQIANNDDIDVFGGNFFSRIGPELLEAGTYLVRVENSSFFAGNGQSGLYRLDIQIQDLFCQPGAIACGDDGVTVTRCDVGLAFNDVNTCSSACDDSGDRVVCTDLPVPTDLGSFPADLPISTTDTLAEEMDGETVINWYTFESTDELLLELILSAVEDGPDLDTRVFLCDPFLFETEQCSYNNNIDNADDGAEELWTLWQGPAPAGVYYLGIETWDGSGGDFNVDITGVVAEDDDTPEGANAITLPYEAQPGSIAYPDDPDWYTFTADPGTFVNINLDVTDLIDVAIVLCDEAQIMAGTCQNETDELAFADIGLDGESEAIIGFELTNGGTYYIQVLAFFGGVGDYTLSVVESD